MSKDIAAWAFIEHAVLSSAERDGSLRDHAQCVEEKYDLPPGYLKTGLIWQTRALSLLYMLILFPKEYWKLNRGDPIYRDIEQRWSVVDAVSVVTPDKRYGSTAYGFVHRLRNALAHASITFQGDNIEIWDTSGRQEVYRAKIGRKEAENFLAVVGSTMANLRSRAVH
ncbi:MAG: hypothetical protein OXG59_09655 [Gammaproteobacteria bacterium]|nr:hypothetical protein [Gammaproteobacteria bacterium]